MASRHVTYIRQQAQTTVPIPPEDVGKIIGRGGSHIRELEATYGVSLRLANNTLSIGGPPDNVAQAKHAVERIVGGGGICILKDLDEKSLHSLLGVEEYLHELQNRFDCYIEIGQRNIIIESNQGSAQNAEHVQRLLQQKLQELTELMALSVPVWDPTLLSEIFNDAALNVLKDRTNLQVEVTKDDSGTGISLNGSRASVVEAQEIIQAILAGEGRQAILPVLQGFMMDLDDQLMLDFQADVRDNIERPYQVQVKYTISGNRFELQSDIDDPSRLKQCIRILQEILIYYFPENCGLFFVTPLQAMDWICGRDDNQLIRLQGRESVISAEKIEGYIWVCASDRQMVNIMNRLEKSLTDWTDTNCIIPLENPKIAGWIIGPGGENLRELQNQTGAIITADGECSVVATRSSSWWRQTLSCTSRASRKRKWQPLVLPLKASLRLGKTGRRTRRRLEATSFHPADAEAEAASEAEVEWQLRTELRQADFRSLEAVGVVVGCAASFNFFRSGCKSTNQPT
eukprot:Protomagalhaensia_sp_Gyna_25__4174@NODE_378_length_3652_cov_249_470246_g289_i0_p1_GENE_NODE_378_length_3652_cov_249_470246_g289_i0NODE_378_length_3652_cov_249_470246_g289_i0_p1_ORF_typecomplete_len524_score78_37KH_1/PF00013_29/7_8e11KH_1/PF00013_29/24KH_1/PF00013_29/4_1e02KH_1/PF00013_29/4_1e06SLS/PF14611_6/5_1e09SLS/PF14611_6/4_8SLS/PF14611_6/2_9e03KH_2/PF07650_17/0_025KH_2/PF07650_17/0_38KH_4/PF13083_6/0_16KH_4/PF13083_6/5_9e02KH_4/PF13083_6/1_5KH_5/PF13184_6/2_3KH_5/PF13184_6/47CoiA/PF06054_1